MKEINCAVCGTENPYSILYPERIQQDKVSFVARKTPDKIHFRIVRCNNCGLTYSNPIYPVEQIMQLYRKSEFIHEPQIENLRKDYKNQLQKVLPLIKEKQSLLEIGCASGYFLKSAIELGFKEVWGVEPGENAVKHADPDVRHKILNTVFSKELFEPETFDVVCCFQIFDHITHPNAFLQDVYRVLRKDGLLLAINHDIKSLMPRIMGEHSPMFDIEHIYLFDKKTMKMILEKNGFEVISVRNIKNSYTIEYCLRMFPMPIFLKQHLPVISNKVGVADKIISISAGNMLSIARKSQ